MGDKRQVRCWESQHRQQSETGNTSPTVRLMHQEEKSDPASFTFIGRDRLYVAYASGIDSCGNCMIRLLGHEKHPVQRSSHREKTRRDA